MQAFSIEADRAHGMAVTETPRSRQRASQVRAMECPGARTIYRYPTS